MWRVMQINWTLEIRMDVLKVRLNDNRVYISIYIIIHVLLHTRTHHRIVEPTYGAIRKLV